MKPLLALVIVLSVTLLVGCSKEYNPATVNNDASQTGVLAKGSGGGSTTLILDKTLRYIAGGTQTGTLKVWGFNGPSVSYTWTKTGATEIYGVAIEDPDNGGTLKLFDIARYLYSTKNTSTSDFMLEVRKSGDPNPPLQVSLSPQGAAIYHLALGEFGGMGNAILTGEYRQWRTWTYSTGGISQLTPLTMNTQNDLAPDGAFTHQLGNTDGQGGNEVVICGSHVPSGGYVAVHSSAGVRTQLTPLTEHYLMPAKVGHLAGDGLCNSIVTGGADHKVFTYTYNGTDYLISDSRFPPVDGDIRDLVIANFDNVGENEVVVAVSQNQPPLHKLYLFAWDGSKYALAWSQTMNGKIFSLAAGNVDADGMPELAVAWANGLQVYKAGGSGTNISFNLLYSDISVKDLFTVAIGPTVPTGPTP